METTSFWLSKRLSVAIVVFFGQVVEFVSYGTMNIAIVAMTSSSTTLINNQNITKDPDFNWDSRTKGIILSSTSIGSVCAAFSGYLALKYGGSTMITIGSLISSIMTLLTPMAAYCNVYLLCIIKVIDGIGVQIKYSSNAELWNQWAPLKERSRLITIGYSGGYAGTVVAYPLCGYIIHRFGWAVAFYFSGGLCFSWMLLWFLTVPNDPSNDKFISRNELQYIKQNQEAIKPPKYAIIFKNMIKSKVILALCSAKFACGVGFTVIVTCLPMFIDDITDATIVEVGILACIPNFITLFVVPLIGYATDTLQNKGSITITQIHKLNIGIGCIGGSALLFVTACYSSKIIISMVCLTIFKILLSFGIVVEVSMANYVAPKCASMVSCFCDIFFHFGTILSPMIVGYIVTKHDALEWSTCFCVFGAILFCSGVLFAICASSEPQPWSYIDEEDSTNCQQTVQN